MEMAKMSTTAEADNKDDEVMLPGFRFHPTDEELVGFYLRRKVEKKPIRIEIIKQADIYKYDPWDLPKMNNVGNKEWYFFCMRGRKYRNSIRPNRVTGSGFWKATGIDKPIYSISNSVKEEPIGLKKSLVYYRGYAGKGTKTDWMMHEFRLPPYAKNTNLSNNGNDMPLEAEVWTLCRIFERIQSYKKYKPEWKETAIKQNPIDSSSKTCSLEESDQNSTEQYMSFGDSLHFRHNERKPVVDHIADGRNGQLFLSQYWNSMGHQVPLAAASNYSSFWNPNGDDFFTNGDWDELRSVVELPNNTD